MTPDEASVVIEEALFDMIGVTPIAWPNRPFTPPATGLWLKADLVWGDAFRVTKDGVTGTGVNEVVGVWQVAGYVRKGQGDGTVVTYMEAIRYVFNRRRLGDVMFGASSGPRLSYEDPWRVATVTVPFVFYETAATYTP